MQMNYMDRYQFWCEAGLPEDVQKELAELPMMKKS